jgi:aminobenzoyl-glutamate transport protein
VRLLDGVERLGNSLPDPIFLFILLIAILFVVSAIAAAQGLGTVNLVTGETFDLFIGSASAKWSAWPAPVVVPMFMLLGVWPEMTTAAYRMGDSFTNIVTPLMSYFPLILSFAQRWDKSFGLGSLIATMLPYAAAFAVAGMTMTAAWVAFDIPVGPGAEVRYVVPERIAPAPLPAP